MAITSSLTPILVTNNLTKKNGHVQRSNRSRYLRWHGWLIVVAVGVTFVSIRYVYDTLSVYSNQKSTVVGKQSTTKTRANLTSTIGTLNFCQRLDLRLSNLNNDTLPIWYACQGEAYNAFTTTLRQFADNTSVHGNTWGRRTLPIPPNTHILWWGNSHARQVAYALLCQQVQAIHDENSKNDDIYLTKLDSNNAIIQVEFRSINASLTLVSNHAMAYRPTTWLAELTATLGRPLSRFTTFILGHTESCEGSGTLAVRMRNETNGTCLYNQVGLQEWHATTLEQDRPILFTSAFSLNRLAEARTVFRKMQQFNTKRTSGNNDNKLAFLYGRQYITDLQTECTAKSKVPRSAASQDCVQDSVGQRCTGLRGGHPDLIAWDVSEFLWYHHYHHQQQQQPVVLDKKPWHVPTLPQQSASSNGDNNADKQRDNLVWCNSTQIAVPHDFLSDAVDIGYQCAGPLYNEFAKALHGYVSSSSSLSSDVPLSQWGRRSFPAPANTRILVWGNSHLRQVLEATLCQQMQRGHLHEINRLPAYQGMEYIFTNNVTIVSLINSWTPYSTKWARLLERELEIESSLSHHFDAIVTGFFNQCGENTTFSRTMESRMDVDCLHVAPPTPWQIQQRFDGRPVVWVSMLDGSRRTELEGMIRSSSAARESNDNNNLAIVDGVAHVRALKEQAECLSSKRYAVDDCADAVYDDQGQVSMRHACFGDQGSLADLVAWDVAEFLHKHLATE